MKRRISRAPAVFLAATLSLLLVCGAETEKPQKPQPITPPQETAVQPRKTAYIEPTAVPPASAPESESPAPTYTDADVEMLAIAIYREAGGDACNDDTRQMVGEVILNRVADPRYPDSIETVLLQRGQYGRMHWTGIVWPDRAELPQEAHAVQRAYDTAEALLSGAVDRLLPTDAVFQAEFPQGTATLEHQDGLYFCR